MCVLTIVSNRNSNHGVHLKQYSKSVWCVVCTHMRQFPCITLINITTTFIYDLNIHVLNCVHHYGYYNLSLSLPFCASRGNASHAISNGNGDSIHCHLTFYCLRLGLAPSPSCVGEFVFFAHSIYYALGLAQRTKSKRQWSFMHSFFLLLLLRFFVIFRRHSLEIHFVSIWLYLLRVSSFDSVMNSSKSIVQQRLLLVCWVSAIFSACFFTPSSDFFGLEGEQRTWSIVRV